MPLDGYQVHFEVEVFEGGRWKIDYVTQDQDEALGVARDLLRRAGIAGVRVLKEVHNSERDVTATRAIFEEMRPERQRPRTVSVRSLARADRAQLFGRTESARTPPDATESRPAPFPGRRRGGGTSGLAALLSLAAGASGTATLLWFALLG